MVAAFARNTGPVAPANVTSVQRVFGFLAELGAVSEILDEALEIHDHDIPDAEVFRGRDGFNAWIQLFSQAWESASLVAEEYRELGDKVVVVARLKARGKGSGIALERRDGIVCTMRDGRLLRLDYYGSPEEALAAAGAEES
jgi:ketosteroid isomerase-like protein